MSSSYGVGNTITQWFMHAHEDIVMVSCYSHVAMQPICTLAKTTLTIQLPATQAALQTTFSAHCRQHAITVRYSSDKTELVVDITQRWYAVGTATAVQQKPCFILLLSTTSQPIKYRTYALCIDAGHGGQDNGAIIHKVREATIALQVSTYIKQAVDRLSWQSISTRVHDDTVPLDSRTSAGRKSEIVLSVHCNSAGPSSVAQGVEILYPAWSLVTWHCSTMPSLWHLYLRHIEQQSKTVAQHLLRGLTTPHKGYYHAKARSIVPAFSQVLQGSCTIGALIELGFLTDEAERQSLTNPREQQLRALQITKTLEHFLNS